MNEGSISGVTRTPIFTTIEEQSETSGTGGMELYMAEAIGTATAAKTFSIAVNIPTNCLILGTQLRVETALTTSDGGTTWSAAFATGSTAACATNALFAQNTKVNTFFNYNAATGITTGTTTITVTADSNKTFQAGGIVRAIVYYWTFVAMGSL